MSDIILLDFKYSSKIMSDIILYGNILTKYCRNKGKNENDE